ncbi:hypothetical protein HK104_010815 [Borealophlyctis nickersoniae]|nr:hypothetical protein HK104_010815 [Borealophlyctis nickersoniae]
MGATKEPKFCTACGEKIEGQFVRALGGHYHLDCFRCKDCNQVVAEKFFPLKGSDNVPQIYCEKDYFRRLDLLCAKCGGALRGPHINALNRKYHLEHFTCSVCPTVFRQHDSYYERDGQVYCQYHYSILYAAKCGGCQTAVLKNFVEVDKENVVEHWHPECYMIHKLWNVKLAGKNYTPPPDQEADNQAEVRRQQVTVEKVGKILHILSAFEESSAECISDMLLQFSNQHYEDGVLQAGKFICHIEALFTGIDDIEMQLAKSNDKTGLRHTKEPKQLAKRIVHFFSLLSYTKESSARKEATKEMISLVRSLAHTLKILIRAALTGALKLEPTKNCGGGEQERNHNNDTAVNDFLERLGTLGDREAESRLMDYGPDVKTDLCVVCKKSVEEECLKFGNCRWHVPCFRCSTCDAELPALFKEVGVEEEDGKAYCPEHSPPGAETGVERVTQLEQYTFLLRCALKRLCILLDVRLDGRPSVTSESDMNRSGDSLPEDSTDPNRSRSLDVSDAEEAARIGTKNVAMHDTTISYSTGTMQRSARPIDSTLPRFGSDSSEMTLEGARQSGGGDRNGNGTDGPAPSPPAYNGENARYLTELSGLEHLAVRQLAALSMHPLVERYFTLDELLGFVETRKRSMWSKMVGAIKKPSKGKPDGTFGVQLDILVERYGVDSDLGPAPSQIRIPLIMDSCMRALQNMDLAVEGIFRKNGNIRRLKTISDDLDRDPRTINLAGDNPIQIAALLKKWLRDMPEPLLTFKLHRLFITSQKLSDEQARKQVLHCVCCLLPKSNLDVLSVLLWFLKEVADHAGSGAHADEGNKMDLDNLATVITPNILYSKSKNPADDESVLAIEAVRMLLRSQNEMWLVPENIAKSIREDFDVKDVNNMPVPELMKRYDRAMRTKSPETSQGNYVEGNPDVEQGTSANIEDAQ